MKTHLFIKGALVFLGLGAAGMAQTVNSVLVEKQQVFTQTDASTTAQTGWVGAIRVEGAGTVEDNLSGLSVSPPSYTTPAGSGVISGAFNNGNYDASADSWHLTNSYASQAALDTDFVSGDYTVTVNSTTLLLNLGGNIYPGATPLGTASAGTWTGGILYVDPSQALTITINSVDFGPGNPGHVSMNLSGNYSGSISYEDFNTGVMSGGLLSIPALTFITGQSYTVEMQFNALSSQDTVNNPNGTGTNSTNAAIYTNLTTFTIIAIPEPAAYASFAGVLALAGVLLARRRQRELRGA